MRTVRARLQPQLYAMVRRCRAARPCMSSTGGAWNRLCVRPKVHSRTDPIPVVSATRQLARLGEARPCSTA